MPLSHIGLTVSHLPTSTSFFLSALQPLGYQYIGQWGHQVGLGLYEADFFLTQETPGIKAGAAHIAFSAASRSAVKAFYTSALTAGGHPHGPPAYRNDGKQCYNAAVLDFDGNSIEVVYHPGLTVDNATTITGRSHVLTWNRAVAEELGPGNDGKSVMSLNSVTSAAVKGALMLAPVANSSASRSQAGSAVNQTSSRTSQSSVGKNSERTLQRSLTEPIINALISSDQKVEMSSKTLVGTILGAAAGAAVAYAMCKSEEDSAKAELEYSRAIAVGSSTGRDSVGRFLDNELEHPPYAEPRVGEAANWTGGRSMRALEPPPPPPPPPNTVEYQRPVYQAVASTQASSADVKYAPGRPQTRVSIVRSNTYPEPTRSGGPSGPPSDVRISEAPRPGPERASSRHSHRSTESNPSKTKSRATKPSSLSKKDRDRSQSRSLTSKRLDLREEAEHKQRGGTSVLGRSVVDRNPWEPVESSGGESDTVLPSDSVSQAGDRPQRPSSTRSKTASSSTRRSSHNSMTPSKNSSNSKSKSKSKSRRRRSYDGKIPVMRPDEIVEPADDGRSISTMTPEKYSDRSKRHSKNYGTDGTVMSLPVRGTTMPSIKHDSRRTVVSYY